MAHGRRRAATLIAGGTLLTAASGGVVAALRRRRGGGDRGGDQRVLPAPVSGRRVGNRDGRCLRHGVGDCTTGPLGPRRAGNHPSRQHDRAGEHPSRKHVARAGDYHADAHPHHAHAYSHHGDVHPHHAGAPTGTSTTTAATNTAVTESRSGQPIVLLAYQAAAATTAAASTGVSLCVGVAPLQPSIQRGQAAQWAVGQLDGRRQRGRRQDRAAGDRGRWRADLHLRLRDR